MSTGSDRRSLLSRCLDVFLDEHNIRWMLCIGLMILLGSSLMLVSSSWDTYSVGWRLVVLLGYTAGVHGFGQLTYHSLGLRKTGTGLMALTVLLLPLTFHALRWIHPRGLAIEALADQAILWGSLAAEVGLCVVAAKRIFEHFLKRTEPTFLLAYVLLCVAAAVVPLLPSTLAPLTAIVVWSVFAFGSLRVNQHVFWMIEEHRWPRIFGFFPVLLLGTQFLGVFCISLLEHISLPWIGAGVVLTAMPTLLAVDALAKTFLRVQGKLTRPFPWSIALPLAISMGLMAAGVGLAATSFPLLHALVPATGLAAVMLGIVAKRTQQRGFVWAMLIALTLAYQFSPTFFREIAFSVVRSTAEAVGERRLPIAFYGLTYLPLLGVLSVIAARCRWQRSSRSRERISKMSWSTISSCSNSIESGHVENVPHEIRQLRQTSDCVIETPKSDDFGYGERVFAPVIERFVGVVSVLLLLVAPTHPKAMFPVGVALLVCFLLQLFLFRRRSRQAWGVVALAMATYGLRPFLNDVLGYDCGPIVAVASCAISAALLALPGRKLDRTTLRWLPESERKTATGWCEMLGLVGAVLTALGWCVVTLDAVPTMGVAVTGVGLIALLVTIALRSCDQWLGRFTTVFAVFVPTLLAISAYWELLDVVKAGTTTLGGMWLALPLLARKPQSVGTQTPEGNLAAGWHALSTRRAWSETRRHALRVLRDVPPSTDSLVSRFTMVFVEPMQWLSSVGLAGLTGLVVWPMAVVALLVPGSEVDLVLLGTSLVWAIGSSLRYSSRACAIVGWVNALIGIAVLVDASGVVGREWLPCVWTGVAAVYLLATKPRRMLVGHVFNVPAASGDGHVENVPHFSAIWRDCAVFTLAIGAVGTLTYLSWVMRLTGLVAASAFILDSFRGRVAREGEAPAELHSNGSAGASPSRIGSRSMTYLITRRLAWMALNWHVLFAVLEFVAPEANWTLMLPSTQFVMAAPIIACLAAVQAIAWRLAATRQALQRKLPAHCRAEDVPADLDELARGQRALLMIAVAFGLATRLSHSAGRMDPFAASLAASTFGVLILDALAAGLRRANFNVDCMPSSENEECVERHISDVRKTAPGFVWLAQCIAAVGCGYLVLSGVISFGSGLSMYALLGYGLTATAIGHLASRSATTTFLKEPLTKSGMLFPAVAVVMALLRAISGAETQWLGFNSLALLGAGAFYFWRGLETRSKGLLCGSAAVLNIALMLLWNELHWSDPQFFMVPIGLSLLGLVELLRAELPERSLNPLRYAGSLVILVSPTFHIVSGSWLHLFSLMVISVTVALLGIGLRLRALLYLGTGFLVADLLAMVVRGGVDNPSVLWLSGIALGMSIVGLAAYCERHREQLQQRVRLMAARLETWG